VRKPFRRPRSGTLLGLLALLGAAATALTVSLFPAAAEGPPSGRVRITDGAPTAPGVYVAGDELVGRAGQRLARAASAPLVGGDGPVAAPSPDGRLVAYSTWAWTKELDWSKAFDQQGIATGDALGEPALWIHDTRGTSDRVLERGAFGGSWRNDGALAYVRGEPSSYRANLPYLANIVVRSSPSALPVAWTTQPEPYRVVGWAGRRLIVARGQEGAAADVEVLDAPGRIRLLAAQAGVLGISPDGRDVLVAVGTPGDGGVTLSLRDVADSHEVARLPLSAVSDPVTGRALVWVAGPASWLGDRVLASSDAGLVVLRVGTGSISAEQVLHVDLDRITSGSIYEPRFADDHARTLVWWADLPAGAAAAPASVQFVCDRYALTCKRGEVVASSRVPRPVYDLSGGVR
jgi:hypothetical protein